MLGNIIRKFLIAIIIIAPVVSYSGCKKQAKCGCGNDVVRTLENAVANVYFNESGTNISFTLSGDPYATFNLCNPGEVFPKLADYKSGDRLLISGQAFWECNYVYQSSNYSYSSMYQVYMVQVTDVYLDLYGKK
jgi:hypothetical protein